MQTRQCISGAGATGFDTPPAFKLLIAYEDFANGRWAMRFLETLVDEFGKLFIFMPRLLRFEDLTRPEVARQAEDEAAEADMVVFAAYGDADLPSLVKDWVRKLGLRRGQGDGALVALLSSSKQGATNYAPSQRHLRAAARRSERKFLCNPINWPAREAAFPVEITRRNDRQMSSHPRRAQCLG
jgi:hypothetical protein